MKLVLALAALLLFIGAASAGTVTLTGTCSSGVINGTANYASFSLLNSGNETATNLVLVPVFSGASPVGGPQTISALAPGQNATLEFHFNNFSVPGSYAGGFTVAYSQGSSSFFALFPCVLNFASRATSLVEVSGINQSGNVLRVNMVNIGPDALSASVGLLLPPGFSYYPRNRTISLQPGGSNQTTFSFVRPQQNIQASYAIAASVSYTYNGIHYSSISQSVLDLSSNSGAAGPGAVYLLYAITAIILLAIIALIIFAVIRKRRMSRGEHPAKQPADGHNR